MVSCVKVSISPLHSRPVHRSPAEPVKSDFGRGTSIRSWGRVLKPHEKWSTNSGLPLLGSGT